MRNDVFALCNQRTARAVRVLVGSFALVVATSCGEHDDAAVGVSKAPMTAASTTCYAAPGHTCSIHLKWSEPQPGGTSFNQVWYGSTMLSCREWSGADVVQVPVGDGVVARHPSTSCNPADKGPLLESLAVRGELGTPVFIRPETCTIAPGAELCETDAFWDFSFNPTLWTKTNTLIGGAGWSHLGWISSSGVPVQLRDQSGQTLYDERLVVGAHADPEVTAGKIKATPEVCEIAPGQGTCSTRLQWDIAVSNGPVCLYVRSNGSLTPVSCRNKEDIVLAWIQEPGYTFELRYGTAGAPGTFIDSKRIAAVPAQVVPANDTLMAGDLGTLAREVTGRVLPNPGLFDGVFALAFSWDGRLGFYNVPLSGGTAWMVRVYRPEASNGGSPAAVDLNPVSATLSTPFFVDTDPYSPTSTDAQSFGGGGWRNTAVLGKNNFKLNGRRLQLSVTPAPQTAGANPYRSNATGVADAAGAYDAYSVLITATGQKQTDPMPYLHQMRGTLVVQNPRTAAAEVVYFRVDQTAVALKSGGQTIPALEPAATADGRLVVFQGHPNSTAQAPKGAYTMYTYNGDPNFAATAWSIPHNVSQLYYDFGPGRTSGELTIPDGATSRKFSDVYPFARFAMRDLEGRVFRRARPQDNFPGDSLPGAYPWITEDGTELVVSAAPIFRGSLRAATLVVGAHTEGTLVNVDTSLNPARGNVSDVSHYGDEILAAYDHVVVGSSELGHGAVEQKSLLPVVAQFGSNWQPLRANRAMAMPSNPFDESLGLFVVPGRYVEAPLERPEYDLLVRLPMNEMLNFNALITSLPADGIDDSQVRFDRNRTPDVSGNFNTGVLSGARFPFEYKDAAANVAGCFDENTATPCTILDGIDGAVGNSILFPPAATVRFPLRPNSKYLAIRDRKEFSVGFFFRSAGTNAQIMTLPYLLSVAYASSTLTCTLLGSPTVQATLSLPNLANDQWHHVAITYVHDKMTIYVDGVFAGERWGGDAPLSDPAADQPVAHSGVLGPSSSGTFRLDELYIYTRTLSHPEVKRLAWIRSEPGVSPAALPELAIPANTYDGLKLQTGTYSAAAAQLGARLFTDTILSYNGTKSCSSCHKAASGFADNQALSVGVNGMSTRRNAPAIFNRVFSRAQFLDGRADSLEAQVLHPITANGELGHEEGAGESDDLETVITRLNASSAYVTRFQTVFGGPPTLARISSALANYVRSIVAQPSTFDTGSLNATQELGWRIFSGKGNCSACHAGGNFTDEKFHDIGHWMIGNPDNGRYGTTKSADDLYKFRTPTLRNVTLTAPYFHNGSMGSLADVVNFYNDGGATQRRGKSIHVRPLRLTTTEKNALVAFLQTLTSLPTPSAPSGIASAPPMP